MIPTHLATALERFRAACQADPRVVAAFVGGSLAAGGADRYSDLDLYIITSDEGYQAFFDGRASFLRQIGQPVYLEDFDGFGFDMVIFILEDGVKGELALARASHFLHIHGGPHRTLVDKTGILEGVSFPLRRIPEPEQRRRLERLLGSFWRNFDLFTGALGRNRPLTAAAYFEAVRHDLLAVCRLSVDFADEGDHPPPEQVLPEALAAACSRTFFPLERGAMIAAAREATRLFRRVAGPLAEAQGIPYPAALERVVLRQFRALPG